MFKKFEYLPLEVLLKTNEKSKLPNYKGSMLRGVLGQTLKKVSCVSKRSQCIECKNNYSCPYTAVFFSIDKNDNDMLSKVETIPNPFVILSPMDQKTHYDEGEELRFYLTLFGKAMSYIHYFIHAIAEIENLGIGADRNKFKIVHVTDTITGERVLENGIYKICEAKGHIFSPKIINMHQITICFDTPLRVRDEGQLTQNISFHLLMRNVLRRIAMIYEYFIDDVFEVDYKSLLEDAKKIKTKHMNLTWVKMQRYSSTVNKKISIGGVKGRVTFEGDLAPFLPYIYLGEITHIGKGCTLGLGHYRIIEY